MENECFQLTELLTLVRAGVENAVPGTVLLQAEIASIQQRASGHCYLELCEAGPMGTTAKARAVIWRSRYPEIAGKFAAATGSTLSSGMSLTFEVDVTFSELYGLTLVLQDIDVRHTLGEAELRRRKTIARLEEEGLTELQKELSLPPVPYLLAIVSAPDAAGLGDFRRHLLENEYGFAFEPTLFEATMQGEGAPASIIAALQSIEASGEPFDAVFILRGGGSVLDLSCFDDYSLCEAIARFPFPVCTAIGHDKDVHAADLVACISVKTPTALADLCIDAVASEDERISSLQTRLRLALNARISAMESRLEVLASRIRAADPRSILSRGYALVTDGRGVVVKSAAALAAGDQLQVSYSDGTVKCTVDGKV